MGQLFSSGPKVNDAVDQQLQAYQQQNVMNQNMQTQLQQQQSSYDAESAQLDAATKGSQAASPNPVSIGAYTGSSSPGSSFLSDGTSRQSFLGD